MNNSLSPAIFNKYSASLEWVECPYRDSASEISYLVCRSVNTSKDILVFPTVTPLQSDRWEMQMHLSNNSSAKMLLKEPEMDHFTRFCVGNHMISSAIWNARVTFFQSLTNLTIWELWKIYKCLFIPNCLRKKKIYIYIYIYKVKSDRRQTVCFYIALRS